MVPLKSTPLKCYKFRRQMMIGPYIVDFVCLEEKLIIEADGSQHNIEQNSDIERTKYLEAKGYRVLRFWNHEVLSETPAVLEKIYSELINSIVAS